MVIDVKQQCQLTQALRKEGQDSQKQKQKQGVTEGSAEESGEGRATEKRKKKKKRKPRELQGTQTLQPSNSHTSEGGVKGEEDGQARQNILDIVQSTVEAMLPSIVKVVQEALMTTLEEGGKHMKGQIREVKEQLRRSEVLAAAERDKLEQYSRRENVIIRGIKENREETEESLCQVVQKVAEISGVQLNASTSISAVHRLGRAQPDDRRVRPIIVRFTSRMTKQKIMKGKKNLKNSAAVRDNDTFTDKVTVAEDLTNARARLLKFINEQPQIEFAYARDGIIVSKLRNGRFERVESPDDLFKLGVDNIRYEDFFQSLK